MKFVAQKNNFLIGYKLGDSMKKKITISCQNKPSEEAKSNFHKLLAQTIVDQNGSDFAKELLKNLNS